MPSSLTLTDLNALRWSVTANPEPLSDAERTEILRAPGFGQYFTDHMVEVHWSERSGWHRPRVEPYGKIALDPAAAVLHYSQEIFEGLKVYRHADGSLWTFRPEANAARLRHSAHRLALPELPTDLFVESLRRLVLQDAAWVPGEPETSLYLRPFMFGSEAFLGVRSARKVYFFIIASPSGSYFKGGVKPVSIWLSTEYGRAGVGGTGSAKTGGNYAASLLPQQEAYEQGCDQVLFLDPKEGRYLDELGGMNIVLVKRDGTLVTPASDSILAGITRDSLLTIAEQDLGHHIERRQIALDEWREGAASGDIVEAFACGTAAVVSPIAQLKTPDFTIGSADAPAGEITMKLRRALTDIQYGHAADTHGWMLRLDEKHVDDPIRIGTPGPEPEAA